MAHPIYAVKRDAKANWGDRRCGTEPGSARESWMHVEVDRLIDAEQHDALAAGIERVLEDVRAAVGDWKPMLARLHGAVMNSSAPRAR
jgi:glutamate dehydrogenase